MLKRFSKITMKDVAICGGKGASLGEMMNAGLPIPNGFVLTTKAYGKNSKDREKQVLEAFDKLDTKFVAVRSSGTKEDGVDDSFAGQFDTYLFVTRENLIKKIKECHDSVNSERIVSYCEYKGIDIKSIKVAVVVQKMVNSESAGVCFTVNPVSENPDEIMIDAGYGVGEAVVSGMITPDNYIVNKKTGEIEKKISQQEKKLVLSNKGGTKEVEIAKEEQETQKLSDKHIEELAELAKKIEKHYRKPMDTEWAVENGELFMLQARPITTLGDNDSNKSVRRDEDNVLNENKKIVKTNKFSVDEFVYLMGKGNKSDTKVVEDFLNNSDWDVQRFNASPVFVNPTGMGNNYIFQKYFGISYSGFFFNYRGHQREMGYNLKDFDRLWAKLGYSYLQPGFAEEVARDYYKIFSYFEDIFEQIDNGLKIDEKNIIEMLKIVNRAQCYSVGIAHSTELINYICTYKLKPLLESEIGKEKFKEIENKIFVADKLSFFAVEQNELYQIAILKKGDNQAKLLAEHVKKWNRILNSYVGAKELDVEFFEKRMGKVLHDGEISLNLDQRDNIIESLPISENYKNIIKLINYTTSWHDSRKANILKTIGYFEMILRKLSSISKIAFDDLLYLSISDIDGLDNLENLINLEQELKQRKKGVIYILNDLKEYIYTGNEYKKLNGILEKLYAEHSTKELKGFVANKGYVKGKVRICNSIEKINEFREGEILVASMTRPEYITAIKKCIAIITDEGGITCHAAIVSRELGKPCIIGTKIATQVLKDGDLVEVDADNGIVRILESDIQNPNKLLKKFNELEEYKQRDIQKFNSYPFFINSVATVSAFNLLPYNLHYTQILCEYKNDIVKWHYDIKDYEDLGKVFWENCKNTEEILKLVKKYSDDYKNSDKNFEKSLTNYKKNKTSESRILLLEDSVQLLAHGAGAAHILECASYYAEKHLTKGELITPHGESFLSKAHKLAKKLKSENSMQIAYKKFLKEYGRIKNTYLGKNTISLKEFTDLVNEKDSKFTDPKYEKNSIEEMISYIFNWQDNRKENIFRAIEKVDDVLTQIAKDIDIDKRTLCYMLPDEVSKIENKEFQNELKKRELYFIDYTTDKDYYSMSGVENQSMDGLGTEQDSKGISEIKGSIGNPGNVTGIVHVCQSLESIKDFKEGDVLVTSMTRPEFIPAMRKASAFVTDEGGITCHAAIISRELGKPCVIGTKIATQVLKDGDLVEVDADNGIVKIL